MILGATVTDKGIGFCAVINCKTSFRLLIYRAGEETPYAAYDFPEENRIGDVGYLFVEGLDPVTCRYAYEIDGVPVPDPYAQVLYGREIWGDEKRKDRPPLCGFVTEEFDWEGDRPLKTPIQDMILYRIHPRGFTKHRSSGVKAKGTFKGIAEKIPYLKELGITALELMPPADFDEIPLKKPRDTSPYRMPDAPDKINYWGYGDCNYFAPKAAYTSDPDRNLPYLEFFRMVKDLHKNGIEVIVEIFFTPQVPEYMVTDVLRYWVLAYHVDGFHIIGDVPLNRIASDPMLADTKLFAGNWNGADRGRRKHLLEYNDGFLTDMRCLIKGDEDCLNQLMFRTRRNPEDMGVVNYMAHTNGFTLMDMVSYDRKHNEDNGEENRDGYCYNYSWNCGVEGPTRRKKILALRKKQLYNALTVLLLSQGVPMLMAGDEMGNTQNGNNNAYCQDNEMSWINWNGLKTHSDLFSYVKFLIAFRKAHPIFHMPGELKVMDYRGCGYPDLSYHGVKPWYPQTENYRRQLGMLYQGIYAGEAGEPGDSCFYVIYNMHWEPHEFSLPQPYKGTRWHLALCTALQESNGYCEPGKEPLLKDQKAYMADPRSVTVLIGKNDDRKG